MSGKNNGACIHKDDFPIIENAFYDSDAVMIGSPVYETSPSGTFKIFCDRIGPSHDLAFLTEAKKERIAQGKSELPDERVFKPRIGCLLGVGGARTKNWTVMTIPIMYECMMSTGVHVIDTHVYYGAMNVEHVLGVPVEMKRMNLMAQNIIDALNEKDETKKKKWRGEEQGVCPVCNQSVLEFFPNTNKVECTICGIEGTITWENGMVQIAFSEKEQKRSRLTYEGKLEHRNEICNGAITQKKVEDLKERKEKYLYVGAGNIYQ